MHDITAEAIHPARLLYWQQIVERFADVASASYFCEVLDIALKAYGDLQSKRLVFHANMEAKMTGEEIFNGYHARTLTFQIMGRSGGRTGARLTDDIDSGRWRRQYYELSNQETLLAKRNWFAVTDFIARVRQTNLPD